MGLIRKIFGSHNDRELKKIYPLADKIEALSDEYRKLTNEQLRGKTGEFKTRLAKGETCDDILPEAFATAREAAWRVLGLYPFRVQLIGGIVLHQGRIAEMKTGEGKTLVATMPAYLNALEGKGVHIVTVNDYLAKRDSEWMGKVYRFLGMSVGLVVHGLTAEERKEAYEADITYGTNNEMGFDYLRDNMAIYKSQMVQRGHAFAIVDEVDSILIDEARTPLIISGMGDKSTELYTQVDNFVSRLKCIVYASIDEKREEDEDLDADYVVDEKARSATLTARGIKKAEQAFGVENLAELENSTLSHHINQAVKAHGIMRRDIDYVVKDEQVIIVDEFTGRLMLGRRYSEGLHQAIEAKERVKVERESKTLATITFQNYFRLYSKLSGMTGTAITEQEEFNSIYNLDVVEIPTNKPMVRIDNSDVIYKNEDGKFRAIIKQIQECHAKGQPVLVGTVSIEKNEHLAELLRHTGIKHNVLNAKNHEKEAEIVAQAGKPYAVTIATNMAGRGTDIVLGGNAEFLAKNDLRKHGFGDEVITEATGFGDTEDEIIIQARAMFSERLEFHKKEIEGEADKVRQSGGLYIIGSERHDSRRIDNQLRGRAGRQGDPGESRFYLSMTDDIMRLFGSERAMKTMERLGVDEDTPLEYKMLTNAIEQAQKTVESRNFQSRKSVLEYDDVMNVQRNVIYAQRRQVLDGEDLRASIHSMIEEYISSSLTHAMSGNSHFENIRQFREVLAAFEKLFLSKGEISVSQKELEGLSAKKLREQLVEKAEAYYARREQDFGMMPNGTPLMREVERVVMLRVVDEYWMEHIDAMQELRRGIGLRAYSNMKPIDAYKIEGFDMFETMISGIRSEVVRRLFTVQVNKEQPLERSRVAKAQLNNVGGDSSLKQQPKKVAKKPGRNEPCPCGKMKDDGSRRLKYKECCGRDD